MFTITCRFSERTGRQSQEEADANLAHLCTTLFLLFTFARVVRQVLREFKEYLQLKKNSDAPSCSCRGKCILEALFKPGVKKQFHPSDYKWMMLQYI